MIFFINIKLYFEKACKYVKCRFVFLVTGLICSAMLKKLSNKANNVKEQVLAKDLEEHSRYIIDVLFILYTRVVLKAETNGVIST